MTSMVSSIVGMVLGGVGAHWLFVVLLAMAQRGYGAPLHWMASLGLLLVTFVTGLLVGGLAGFKLGETWEDWRERRDESYASSQGKGSS